jgi:hypothetical protein
VPDIAANATTQASEILLFFTLALALQNSFDVAFSISRRSSGESSIEAAPIISLRRFSLVANPRLLRDRDFLSRLFQARAFSAAWNLLTNVFRV